MEQNNSSDLLQLLKRSLGVINIDDASLDEFYLQKINEAIIDYTSEDINESVLKTDFGQNAIVFYAKLLLENVDIATNPTIIFLKNKLSALTKGENLEKGD